MVKWMLKQDESLDRVFHALADSSRRNMVERLSAGPASVTELARPLPMTLAAVVQHVQVLEAAGLVRTEKVGRVRRCEINLDTLRPVDRWIAERRAMWGRAFDQLGSVLGQPPPAHADRDPRSAR
jgi:DNA-binding transcriptional ArsR family regulator